MRKVSAADSFQACSSVTRNSRCFRGSSWTGMACPRRTISESLSNNGMDSPSYKSTQNTHFLYINGSTFTCQPGSIVSIKIMYNIIVKTWCFILPYLKCLCFLKPFPGPTDGVLQHQTIGEVSRYTHHLLSCFREDFYRWGGPGGEENS